MRVRAVSAGNYPMTPQVDCEAHGKQALLAKLTGEDAQLVGPYCLGRPDGFAVGSGPDRHDLRVALSHELNPLRFQVGREVHLGDKVLDAEGAEISIRAAERAARA